MDKRIQLYQNCLLEIKNRTSVISDHLNGIYTEKYLITEVEFLCLQFRKILEKIALASMVANNDIYSQQYKKFAQHYHAERILNDLEKINPNFYPIPTKQVKVQNNEKIQFDLQPITEGFLTKDEFIKIYEKCGGMLHAENPYGNKKEVEAVRNDFPTWLQKIIVLLNHHHITLVDGKTIIVGLMQGADNGLPQVTLFEKI